MSVKMWFGPVGAEMLGMGLLGNPVVADEDGVVEMTPLPGVKSITFNVRDDDSDGVSP